MRAKEREHLRDCAELKRELDGTAEELISRVQKLTGGGDAFDVWAHSLRQACGNPANEQAREYCFAAMRELVDTREEAIAEFQNFSGGVEGHAAKVSPAVAEGLGLTPQSHPKGAFQGVPLKDRSGNQAPPAEISTSSGAATFQGMEFTAEGLSEEEVNSLLTMKEEG